MQTMPGSQPYGAGAYTPPMPGMGPPRTQSFADYEGPRLAPPPRSLSEAGMPRSQSNAGLANPLVEEAPAPMPRSLSNHSQASLPAAVPPPREFRREDGLVQVGPDQYLAVPFTPAPAFMVGNSNLYAPKTMFTVPLGGAPTEWVHSTPPPGVPPTLPEGVAPDDPKGMRNGFDVQATVQYPLPAKVLSAHAYVGSEDILKNWTLPGAAPVAQSEYLNYVERNINIREKGGAERLDAPPPQVPYAFWAELDRQNEGQGGAGAPYQLTEANASRGCTGAPHPSEGVAEKHYYNTYTYWRKDDPHTTPAHVLRDKEFTGRFVEAANGVWQDTWAMARHDEFIDEKVAKEIEEEREREAIESGEALRDTPYVDKYSTAHLIAVGTKLCDRGDIQARFKIRNDNWQDDPGDPDKAAFSFDTLRCFWPFDPPQRNKIIHDRVYGFYDRRNPCIGRDEDYNIVEMNCAYVDGHMFDGEPLESDDPWKKKIQMLELDAPP